MPLFLLLLAGCGDSVAPLYEERRAAALAQAPPAQEGWHPDAVLLLSQDLVSDLLTRALAEALADPEPIAVARVATVKPKGQVRSVTLTRPKDACEGCLTFKARVTGDALVTAGRAEREVPFEATLAASLVFTTRPEGALRVLEAQVKEVRRAEVQLGRGADRTVDLDAVLIAWADKALSKAPPLALGELGGDDLPVRDLRVKPSGQGLRVELLTQAARGAALSKDRAAPRGGWEVAVSEATLLDLARVEAFKQGEIDLDIHAEPLSLDVDGARFTMGLRLWRLSRPGWWRDYEIRGGLSVVGKELRFAAEEVSEVGASEGAGLADPLALLGQSLILDVLREAAAGTLPAQTRSNFDGLGMVATLQSVRGEGDMLLLSGTAGVSAAKAGQSGGSATRGAQRKEAP